MKSVINLLVLLIITNYAHADENTYEPNYIYGSQPLGTYVGGFVQNNYSGQFVPNTPSINNYYTPQSGQPMDMSQFIQGQEQLMQSNAKEAQLRKQREKEIADYLQQEYHRQIHNPTEKVTKPSSSYGL